jgi:hypothetical protein
MGLISKGLSLLLIWGTRIVALLALLYSLSLIARQDFWISPLGGTSSISVGSASVLYLFAQYQLARDGRGELNSVVLGALFANAFLQTYEIIYHFTFPIYSLQYPFLQGADVKFLIVDLTMVLPLLLMRKELSFKRVSAYALGLFVLSMIVWVLFGFPQYFSNVFYIQPVLHTGDPYHLSLALNYGSKVILAVFFLSLLKVRRPGMSVPWGRKAKAAPQGIASGTAQFPL